MLATTSAGAQEGDVNSLTPIEGDQAVDITVEGLEPGSKVFLVLCNPGSELVDFQAQCSLIGAGTAGYEVDAEGGLALDSVVVPTGAVGSIEGATCPPAPDDPNDVSDCLLALVDENLRPVASAALDELDEGALALVVEPPEALPETGPPAGTALLAAVGLASVAIGGASLDAARRRRGSFPQRLPATGSAEVPGRLAVDSWPADIWAIAASTRDLRSPPRTGGADTAPRPVDQAPTTAFRPTVGWTPWVRPGHEAELVVRHRRRHRVRSIPE